MLKRRIVCLAVAVLVCAASARKVSAADDQQYPTGDVGDVRLQEASWDDAEDDGSGNDALADIDVTDLLNAQGLVGEFVGLTDYGAVLMAVAGGDVAVYDNAPCGVGDGIVDVDDLIGILDAFSGIYACTCPGGAGDGHSLDASDGNPVDALYVNAAGNVGIGTVLPITKLHVVGNNIMVEEYGSPPDFIGRRANGTVATPTAVVNGSNLVVLSGAGWDGADFTTEGTISIQAAETWTATAHGTDIEFLTTAVGSLTSSVNMVIQSDGNVGIGTVAPTSALHVQGDNIMVEEYGDLPEFVGRRANGTASAPTVVTSASNLVVLSGAGWDGADFTTQGSVAILAAETWTAAAHGTDIRFSTTAVGGTLNSVKMTIQDNGNVGIGETTPDVALDVTGDINYTGVIVDVSDARLKENVAPVRDALRKVQQLDGVYFNMKDVPNQREVGLIAQNVQEVLPEAVHVIDRESGHLGVSYPSVIPLLIEAIKELQADTDPRVLRLERDNARLADRLAAMEKLVAELAGARNSRRK